MLSDAQEKNSLPTFGKSAGNLCYRINVLFCIGID